MIQILAHLWADFVFQPNKWALNKRKDIRYAFLHSLQYGLVYWLFFALFGTQISLDAMLLIVVTHIFIDRYYPARWLIFGKNRLVEPSLKWNDCSSTGYPSEIPKWLSMWLLIIVDNTMHLTINEIALRLL